MPNYLSDRNDNPQSQSPWENCIKTSNRPEPILREICDKLPELLPEELAYKLNLTEERVQI